MEETMKLRFVFSTLALLVAAQAPAAVMDTLQQTQLTLKQGERKVNRFQIIKPNGADAFVAVGAIAPTIPGVNCEIRVKDGAGVLLSTYDCGGNSFDYIKTPAGSPALLNVEVEIYNADFSTASRAVSVQHVFRFGTLLDADGDGMPSWFEEVWGFSDQVIADALADKDNDGVSNLNEYLNNTNPTVANSGGNNGGGNGGGGTTPPLYLGLKKTFAEQHFYFPIKSGRSGSGRVNLSSPAGYPALVNFKLVGGGINLSSDVRCSMVISYVDDNFAKKVLHQGACNVANTFDMVSPQVPRNKTLTAEFSIYNNGRVNVSFPLALEGTFGDVVDKDLDGMPVWFEELHGFSDSVLTDAADDADSDGYSNLTEFNAGTSPKNPASKPI